MKQIVLSLLTVGTTLAGYTAYQRNPSQFAPIITRIQTFIPALSSTNTSPTFQPTGLTTFQQNASTSTQTQTASNVSYVELLYPHSQAAFSPLEQNQGKLSEDPILRLREMFAREREREEAREAIAVVDRLLTIMRERELFRQRFENTANSEFLRERVRDEWQARAKELGDPFDRDWARFAARDRERVSVAELRMDRAHQDFARREELARREEFKPRFENHAESSFLFGRNEHAEEHHNPFVEEHHNPLEHGAYHNPLDNMGRPEVGHVEHGLENHTTTGNPLEEHHVAGPTGNNGLQSHNNSLQSHNNGLQTQNNGMQVHNNNVAPVSHPVVTHPAPRPAVVTAPTTVGGGA